MKSDGVIEELLEPIGEFPAQQDIWPGSTIFCQPANPGTTLPYLRQSQQALGSQLQPFGIGMLSQANAYASQIGTYTPPSEYDWALSDYMREDARKLKKLLRKGEFGSEHRRKACRDAFEAKTLLRPAGR